MNRIESKGTIKNTVISILFSVSLLISSTPAAADIFSKNPPPVGVENAWTKSSLQELAGNMKDVSKDVKQFFKQNPNLIADMFGGTAYNVMEALKAMTFKLDQQTKNAILWWADLFGIPAPPSSDGATRICESPRICLGVQYKVAESLINHTVENSNVSYYFTNSPDGSHNFITALPKGVPPTSENLQIQGVVIDPWRNQSGDSSQFIFPGSDPYYRGSDIGRVPVSRQGLSDLFNNTNPFNSDPIVPVPEPTPTPSATPDPTPSPTPTPPPVCSSNIYQRDASGTYVLVLGANGQYVPILSQDVIFEVLFYKNPTTGVISGVSGYAGVPQCDWDVNSQIYLNDLINQLPRFQSTGINCVGTYFKPAGTVLDYQYDTSSFSNITCIP
ncbi:MAG: hypothetical protein AABZ55_08115 [Bdellovibrionota bacterium]